MERRESWATMFARVDAAAAPLPPQDLEGDPGRNFPQRTGRVFAVFDESPHRDKVEEGGGYVKEVCVFVEL